MKRWAAAAGTFILAAALPAAAQATYQGTDVFGQLAPTDHAGGLADAHPLSYYGLDWKVDGPSVGLGGISTGDVPATIAQFLAGMLFTISTWLINVIISVFTWAFQIDLLNGAHGALAPIGRVTQELYQGVLGPSFLAAATIVAGGWAMHKALVQRRFTQASSGIAMSVLLVVIAMVLIAKPAQTIGEASRMTNQLSNELLSTITNGDARTTAKNHLFRVFVYEPWVVAEFGGLKHCVGAAKNANGFPKPVAPNDPKRTVCRDHLKAHDGYGGYAERYLTAPPQSDERQAMYAALAKGEPDAKWPGWKITRADSSAVDVQQAGGSFQRLALAILVFIATLGAVLMLGMLAFAALLAQAIALGLLAFAPVALLAGAVPGAGHKLFRAWLSKLGIALFVKAIYTLVLTVLLAVSLGLDAAVGAVGYLFAFGLQAAFFWTVFAKRKALAGVMLTRKETTQLDRRTSSVTKTAATALTGGAGGLVWGKLSKSDKDEARDDATQQKAQRRTQPPPTRQDNDMATPTPTTTTASQDDAQHAPTGRPPVQSPGLADHHRLPPPAAGHNVTPGNVSSANGNRETATEPGSAWDPTHPEKPRGRPGRPRDDSPQTFAEAASFGAAPEKPAGSGKPGDLPASLEAARKPEPVSYAEAAGFDAAPEKPAAAVPRTPRQPEKPAAAPRSFTEAEQQQRPNPQSNVFKAPEYVPERRDPQDGVFKPEEYRPAPPEPVRRGLPRDPQKS